VHECDVCGAKVLETRRGRCWGCYNRWVDARPVGRGARCLCCGERRVRMLRAVELWGGWQPMCFNCSGQALALSPMPPSVEALREALTRDRRKRDRRWGKPDTRVFQYERRVGERRDDRPEGPEVDDGMIVEVSLEASLDERDEMTRIHDLAAR
jgi:hypothetical protein